MSPPGGSRYGPRPRFSGVRGVTSAGTGAPPAWMKKQRRRGALERLGDNPAEITPAEELQEAAELLFQQEPEPPAQQRPPRPSEPDYVEPGLIDPAD
jgi:hypothetical protein